MAVTVADTRTVINEADSLTNWTGASTLNTTDFAESTACVAEAYNIATGQIYYTGAPLSGGLDLSGQCVYVQSYTNALQNSWLEATLADSSHGMWISDGTNEVVALQAGNDRDVFKHSKTMVSFQSFLLDTDYASTKNTAGEVYMNAGTFASWDSTSITQLGSYFVTLSKALGGGDNCFVDIMRYGNDGLRIYGGTTADRGIFSEIVALDESKAAGRAHGIIREYTAGAYGCQGTLQFGTPGASGDSWFDDTNISLTFEDRDVADDKFRFVIQGNTTDSNNFFLSNSSINSARPGVTLDASSSNIDNLIIDGVSFNSLKNSISFPTDTATTEHQVTDSTFNGCGQVDPGTVIFESNNFSESTSTLGALLLDADGSDNWLNLTFNGIPGATGGHAIYIPPGATGTYELTGLFYNNYSGTGATAAVYNNSGGAVTLNIAGGGDTPTVRNGTGSTTTVNNNVSVTLTGLPDNTEVRIFAAGTTTELAGVENATDGVSGDRSFTFSLAASTSTDVRIVNKLFEVFELYGFSIPTTASSIPISLRFDRNYI